MALAYRLKRQRRKTLALHVLADGQLELRAPTGAPQAVLQRFFEQHREWAQQTQRELLARKQQRAARARERRALLGVSYPLRCEQGACGQAALVDGEIVLSVRGALSAEKCERVLQAWYREQAAALFAQRLHVLYARFSTKQPPPTLALRQMRRRWGSCSSRRHITLNIRLLELPLWAIDYVIVHELCHLWHLHHGPSFYALLQSQMPKWREYERALRCLGDD